MRPSRSQPVGHSIEHHIKATLADVAEEASAAQHRTEAVTRLLASIVETSDDAIISKDINGIVTSWNAGATRIFGYTADEMIGKPVSVLAPPERANEMPKILERIRKGERIEHYQTVRRAKNGQLLNISLTVSPLRDADGRIIGASKVARDVTREVRFARELAEQREHLRVTLQSIGDGVIATDHTGAVTYLNSVAEDLTRWRNPDAVGKSLQDVFRIIDQDSRRRLPSPAQTVLHEGRIVGHSNNTMLIAKDGRERTIETNAAPIRNDLGAITGVVIIFRDVTEHHAKKRLEHQAEELRRINEELSRFAYIVSHDLREPLRNISIFSELVASHCQDRPHLQTAVKNIVDGVHRMGGLLQALLEFSRIGGGEHTPTHPCDMNEILKSALTNLRTQIQETEAEITSDPLPSIPGHETQLLQLLQNLISNAIKYRSHAPPSIQIHVKPREHEFLFSVRDNGIGIDAKHHESIFGIFKRLHNKDIPGTGVGLAICSKVVEIHGGHLWVESKKGHGSEFFFTLPMAPATK
jgi:PAS domain S-box-containing protein